MAALIRVGWMWVDNRRDRDLREKVLAGARRYRSKFGRPPNVCYVNAALLDQPENDRRAGQRYQKAQKDCFSGRKSHLPGQGEHGQDGQSNLEHPAHDNSPFYLNEFLEGELDADGKEQQHHPYLG